MIPLDVMGMPEDPLFGNIARNDSVKRVFNLSQDEDVRGPWNEEPDIGYVAEPKPMGSMPPAPVDPDG